MPSLDVPRRAPSGEYHCGTVANVPALGSTPAILYVRCATCIATSSICSGAALYSAVFAVLIWALDGPHATSPSPMTNNNNDNATLMTPSLPGRSRPVKGDSFT